MRRSVMALMALLLVLFVALWLRKSADVPGGETAAVEGREGSDQESIKRFWDLYRLATDYRVAGRLEEAAAAYREALTLNEEHEDALYYLGNVGLERGAFAEARQAWTQLAEVNPRSARAHAQLGDLHFCWGQEAFFDLDVAEVAFQRALTLNKEETGPLLRLGQMAIVRGDLEAATYYLKAVSGSNFKSIEAYALRGYLAWKQGEEQRMAEQFEYVVRYLATDMPAEGVLGEGDTKAGVESMMARASKCPLFQPYFDELMQLGTMPDHWDPAGWCERLDFFLTGFQKDITVAS